MTARQARAGWRGGSRETGTSRRKAGSAWVLLRMKPARERAEGAKRYLEGGREGERERGREGGREGGRDEEEGENAEAVHGGREGGREGGRGGQNIENPPKKE